MSLEADLLATEHAFWTGGPEAYADHCEPECLLLFVGQAGMMDRDAIARSAERGRWTEVVQTPVALARLSPTAAVIAYRCDARRRDGRPYRALVSSSNVLRGESWKLAAHHQTELPQEA